MNPRSREALSTIGEPALDEYVRRLGALPLVHQPGERWMYETAADVTGALIARATGMTFGDALRERIFEPLGMNHTGFSVASENIGRLATAYAQENSVNGEPVVDDGPDGLWSRPPVFEGGGGGLVSTADDFLAFASALLAGGSHRGERILSRPSVSLMTTDQLTAEQKAVSGFRPGYFDAMGWAFGMSVQTRRTHLGPSVGTYGWPGSYGTAWYNDPAEDMSTIVMMQRGPRGRPAAADVERPVDRRIPIDRRLSARPRIRSRHHRIAGRGRWCTCRRCGSGCCGRRRRGRLLRCVGRRLGGDGAVVSARCGSDTKNPTHAMTAMR